MKESEGFNMGFTMTLATILLVVTICSMVRDCRHEEKLNREFEQATATYAAAITETSAAVRFCDVMITVAQQQPQVISYFERDLFFQGALGELAKTRTGAALLAKWKRQARAGRMNK
jgi:hypothetical protein